MAQVDGAYATSGKLTLQPPETYLPVVQKAAAALANFPDSQDLYEMLFSKEELLWLKSQYRAQHDT